MSHYAPRMSQALKDHIWVQLSLGYTIKQIYDKYKTIWSKRVNASQSMTRDDFIWLQDIAYLDWKHKKGGGIYTPTQCESMLSYGHNGANSMDAAFCTNDMKFHLFTLMGFDDHRMGIL
jgi:hypothetical protein